MVALLLILLCASLFLGIVQRVRSILSGRKGPKLLQPLFNVQLLLRKKSVFSTTSSIVSQIAPTIALCATLTAVLLLPAGRYFPAMLSFNGDFVLFAYLLALSRFMYILNALDTGGAFEGMGASREALFGLLIEPAFLVIMGSMALITGNTSFTDIQSSLSSDGINGIIVGILISFIFFNLMLIENGRMPVDDSKTHLELTMRHEAMILDNSGFDLALIHITTYLRFAAFGSLIAMSLISYNVNGFQYILLYLLIQFGCAVAVGWFESFKARYPMVKNASYMLAISSIALIAFMAIAALVQFK
jgi:formate hydrogenlyase subunit 4